MSHFKERKEKVCLNCGAALYSRYCHICGQENIEPKESVSHLITHFLYDLIHFDGKFFSTLKYLLLKPGFLSAEYLIGRRVSYLHPIRMYIFTSAFFFLIFFGFYFKTESVVKENKTTTKGLIYRLTEAKGDIIEELLDSTLSANKRKRKDSLLIAYNKKIAFLQKDTTKVDSIEKTVWPSKEITILNFTGTKYRKIAEYDSIQQSLPKDKKDNWIKRKLIRQELHLKEKYSNNPSKIWPAIGDKLAHYLPQIFFISLPFFAMLLKLIYLRRKSFYYVNHLIYALHLYIAFFIITFIGLIATSISNNINPKANPDWIGNWLSLLAMFYFYKSLRNFYKQKRLKTILKLIIIFVLTLILLLILFGIFFIFSTFTI